MSDPDATLLAAAWWHARQRDGNGEADRAGLQAWQTADLERGQAYAAVSRVADAVAAAAPHRALQDMADAAVSRASRQKRGRWPRIALVAAATAAAPLAALTLHYVQRPPIVSPQPMVIATAVGDVRRIMLKGGGELLLDSASRVIIRQAEAGKSSLEIWGQAYLTGAPPNLIVRAGPLAVRPRGGAFNIRNLQGKQEVFAVAGAANLVQGDAQASLSSGQKVRLVDSRATITRVADPELILGWRHGWLHFDDASVQSAVVEMNRYRRHPLVVADDAVGAMRISGSFRISDSDSFAGSLKTALPLRIRHGSNGATELIAAR